MFFDFDLQMFADAGTLTNTSVNFVNSYTGAGEAFDEANTLSQEMKAFYDTELLENARTETFYAQFAKRQPLPANHHGSVEWRKWNTFDRAGKHRKALSPLARSSVSAPLLVPLISTALIPLSPTSWSFAHTMTLSLVLLRKWVHLLPKLRKR